MDGDAIVAEAEAERVSSERSYGSGCISPLLSPSPAAALRAGWRVVPAQVLHHPSARPPVRSLPNRGESVQACPRERKLGGRALQRDKATPKPSSLLFPSQEGFSSTSPPNSDFQTPRGMDGGKESCTSARALGGAPLLVEVGSRGPKRSFLQQRGRSPGEGRYQADPANAHTHLPAPPAALPLALRCPLPRPTLPPHPLPPQKRLRGRKAG